MPSKLRGSTPGRPGGVPYCCSDGPRPGARPLGMPGPGGIPGPGGVPGPGPPAGAAPYWEDWGAPGCGTPARPGAAWPGAGWPGAGWPGEG
ncbi:hypothetical protein OWR29_30160 [Actinoplanes sp. Pm04-4]|uniref:Uncharacterized protein n=1 Tax=Paractinoplanes pyxinae TaxID=2997416 RepID=A0ABT4B6Z0_9ACTN|nr:hypothetical protein [Actinoplanes pyxinae]MCY1142281.1 hypothetical protein [Actinoplanes pyxinae]